MKYIEVIFNDQNQSSSIMNPVCENGECQNRNDLFVNFKNYRFAYNDESILDVIVFCKDCLEKGLVNKDDFKPLEEKTTYVTFPYKPPEEPQLAPV